MKPNRSRRGFTLVELMITISIIGIMAGMVLFALFSAQESAKEHATRTLIGRLDSIIRTRYESYRTRRVPITIRPGTQPPVAARMRLDSLRDLMRMEMPERWSDIYDGPYNNVQPIPSVAAVYRSRWAQVTGQSLTNLQLDTSKDEHQGAECLYMIVMACVAQEGDSRDAFRSDQIGDTDNDGFPEFVDAWKQPIRFLRWAPGFNSSLQSRTIHIAPSDTVTPGTNSVTITLMNAPSYSIPIDGAVAVLPKGSTAIQWDRIARVQNYSYDVTTKTATILCTTPSYTQQQPFFGQPPQPDDQIVVSPSDPFDFSGVYPIYSTNANPPSPDTSVPTFSLIPLIYSAGPDKAFGVRTEPASGATLRYADPTVRVNPFMHNGSQMIGSQDVFPGEPSGSWIDNITNHDLMAR